MTGVALVAVTNWSKDLVPSFKRAKSFRSMAILTVMLSTGFSNNQHSEIQFQDKS